jgi:hypothetical protein
MMVIDKFFENVPVLVIIILWIVVSTVLAEFAGKHGL